jgi:hypothetical protein
VHVVLVALALSRPSLEDRRRRSRRLRRRWRWDRSRWRRWVGSRRGWWRRWVRPWLRRFRPWLQRPRPRLGVVCSSRRRRSRTNPHERDCLYSTLTRPSAPLRLRGRLRCRPWLSAGRRGLAQARQRAERRTLKLELKCRRSRDEHLLGRREIQRRAPQVTSAHRRSHERGQPQSSGGQHRRQCESSARRRA